MSIKKRLFISNILMIVIPIILALVTLFSAYELVNIIFHGELPEIFADIEAEREVRFGESWESMESQILLVGIACIAGLIAVIYITNRFLISFVFSKIKRPLDILKHGVRQIKDGNLDYNICYDIRDEFQPVCNDFNEMARRLKSSVERSLKDEQSRKELIAGISHDLRSPLTSIKAYVEGLIDGVAATPKAEREYLQIIKTKTDDISRMVSQLFFFARMDAGNYPVNAENLNLAREITDFVNATREYYKSKNLAIDLSDLSGIADGVNIYSDPTQLRSVFTNILDNSAKYKVRESGSAFISCETNGDDIIIFFDDDGPGVPDDSLTKIFGVFYRGDISRNNPHQGSGLGLAIASKMTELMNGTISADKSDKGGLRIILKLPLIKEDNR